MQRKGDKIFMETEDIISRIFFNSYKSFIDYLILISNIPNEYIILVSKNIVDNELTKVNITIDKNDYIKDYLNNIIYRNNVILHNEKAKELIDEIRNNFKNNYYIIYSCVNPSDLTQTIQSNKIALRFKLYSHEELEEAMKFNKKTNCNKIRRKELMKN